MQTKLVVTVNSRYDDIPTLSDLENDIRGGPGANNEGGLFKIRSMNHLLNRVVQDIMTEFEEREGSLSSRIDWLTDILSLSEII